MGFVDRSVWRLVHEMAKFLEWNKDKMVTKDVLRCYLEPLGVEPRNNALRAFKRFFRDFKGCKDLVKSFKFVKVPPKLILDLPSKEDMRKVFECLDTVRAQSLFLLYASSGLRRQELLDLTFGTIDFNLRMLVPNHSSRTKSSYISFYNDEAEDVFLQYIERLPTRDKDSRPFSFGWQVYSKIYMKVLKKTGVNVCPQILREWFCTEMGELGVPDRFIDAFCGRVPRSILARHYTDYSPARLKRIYDKAGLKVLG